jgi:hypothetical protein
MGANGVNLAGLLKDTKVEECPYYDRGFCKLGLF